MGHHGADELMCALTYLREEWSLVSPPRAKAATLRKSGVARLKGDAATQEVDQTLRQARIEIEGHIARYRLWLIASVGLICIPIAFGTGEFRYWVAAAFCGAVTLYALAVRSWLRIGASSFRVAFVTSLVDLTLSVAFFPLSRFAFDDDRVAADIGWVMPMCLAVAILFNVLRYSRLITLVATTWALVLFYGLTFWLHGQLRSPHLITGVLLVVTGLIGMAVARHTRFLLKHMARVQLLRRYLPAPAVERVMNGSLSEVFAPGGKLVRVTIVATDLRGFTALATQLSPSEVVQQLNAYHSTMLEHIHAHGGVLDKFIGDGALAVFGLGPQQSQATDAGAASAVACGRAMLAALEELNARRNTAGQPSLQMGIGIHTGEVVAGNIGAASRLEFTVIGDAVNVASRLESKTKELQTPLLVSAATYFALGSPEGLAELPAVNLRGVQSPLRVFALSSKLPTLASVRSSA